MRLIDTDALKKTLVKLWNIHDDQDFANKDVWREIENAPTIDPEKRTMKANYLGFQVYKCDCGFYLRRFYDGVQVNFCPVVVRSWIGVSDGNKRKENANSDEQLFQS